MKKMIRWLAAVGMTAALLSGAAFAAEESGITVQLDGQPLAFTDAVPQVKDQRTFLPFRAVFEAMGAEVDNEGSVITATKDGKTLTMTLNETAATLTEGEETTPITMDVAPYVDNTTWRTYVPVRFAAQAFGCSVGWDQANSTAIIIDPDKLVDEALEGKEFTYLEKMVEYSEKYNKGLWDAKGSFDASLSIMGMPITMNGTLEGTVQDSEKMSMDMNMKMDLTEYLKSIALLAEAMGSEEPVEIPAETQAMLDSLKKDGVDLSMRGDMLGSGVIYMNMAGDLMEAAGMNSEDWYKLDMAAIMEQAGMDWAELVSASKSLDYAALAKQSISSFEPTDSATAYEMAKTLVEEIAAALSDEGFVKEGNEYTAMVDIQEGNTTATLVLVLGMKKDAVVGYTMGVNIEAEEEGTVVSMGMTIAVDDKDQMSAEMHMDMASLLTMELNMNCGYTQGKTAPATEPPAGANVVDYMELLGAQMGADVGVIGGADGPTSIIVGE